MPIAIEVDPAETQRIESLGKQFCPRERIDTDSPEALSNEQRQTFGELLGITPIGASIRYKSTDWDNNDDIEAQLKQALKLRPRLLTSTIHWSEGANPRRRSFWAVIHTAEGADVHMQVSGYQICGDDVQGRRWYFRNVAIDLWP